MEVYVGKDKGRWPKGTRVRKVCSQPGDAHEDGALGTIVGALGPTSPSQRAELIIELAKKGVNGDVEYFYWVEWDDMLGIPVGIADCRIEPIEELGRQPLKEVKVKVIDSMWFNTLQGSFGFVVGEDETTGNRRLYASVVSGLDQKADEQAILSWGNKVNIGMMEGLIAKTKKSSEKEGVTSDALEALKAQHQAIDRLFAELIKRDPGFFPSKSGQPWEACKKGNAVIKRMEG